MEAPDDGGDDSKSPLDDVFIDDTKVDEERIASILRVYANVGQSSGRLQPTDAYDELNADVRSSSPSLRNRRGCYVGISSRQRLGQSGPQSYLV